MTNIDQEVYPVIVFALARKVIGLSLQYTLILTNQDFYEKLDDCDWIGAEFALAIQDCDNGSYPESAGLWTAYVKLGLDDEDDPTLIQESPWRLLTSEEADRLAEGLPIEEVIVTGVGAQSRVKRVLLIYDCFACKTTFSRLTHKDSLGENVENSPSARCRRCGQRAQYVSEEEVARRCDDVWNRR